MTRPQYWQIPEPEKKITAPNHTLGPTQEKILIFLRGKGWIYGWQIDEHLGARNPSHTVQKLHKLELKGHIEGRLLKNGVDRLGRKCPRGVYQWRIRQWFQFIK